MGRRSRIKWCLLGCLIGVVALVGASAVLPGRLTNTVKMIANTGPASRVRALTEQETVIEDNLVEMVVENVGVSRVSNQPVVVLKEKAGERYLFIWIGFAEANAISVATEGVNVPRPLTHDLICSVTKGLGASVNSIIINDIKDNTFYATIVLTANWIEMEIDSRPSDAIAIAVRIGVPIYAEEKVIDEAGIRPEQETEGYTLIPIETNKLGISTPSAPRYVKTSAIE